MTAITNIAANSTTGVSALSQRVAKGCSEVAETFAEVEASFSHIRDDHAALKSALEELQQMQELIDRAGAQGHELSENALEELGSSSTQISQALGRIEGLIAMVEQMAAHIEGFASAMTRVSAAAHDIERIVATSNILALNANIEAKRAGEAGETFSKVAEEVRTLAEDASGITEEIQRVIGTLEAESSSILEKVREGAAVGRAARQSVEQIQHAIQETCVLLIEVDGQQESISSLNAGIGERIAGVVESNERLQQPFEDNCASVSKARERTADLRKTAAETSETLAHLG
ncbi:methyl-accepting chemotaxis protein [Qipengyuania sphaerica]|uniref:methyl-accepting chemotaxis protein n=1 Tax=Qipengyuania sphaerica TaxID=2867243 RepID=UPI001C87B201|nr:methyl-accepting chemotaxis protein [Qipengyuania sphaerica]MBX7540719.1 hypothetical protein [Qipengyuania sphaerica]